MATGTPEGSWTGYSPGPYRLSREVLSTLTVQVRGEQDPTSGTSQSLLDVFTSFAPRLKNAPDDVWDNRTVDTTDGRHVFEGDDFSLRVLRILFTLHAKGANAVYSTWFYCGMDNMTTMPSTAYHFFVVDEEQDRIVDPEVALFHSTFKDFRADLLTSLEAEAADPIWWSDAWWSDADRPMALSRVWYPRFYTQTTTGQMMVARDRERLFFFARPPQAEVDMGEMSQARDNPRARSPGEPGSPVDRP
jgi:hypothetical protein